MITVIQPPATEKKNNSPHDHDTSSFIIEDGKFPAAQPCHGKPDGPIQVRESVLRTSISQTLSRKYLRGKSSKNRENKQWDDNSQTKIHRLRDFKPIRKDV
jgi:hypothetical protein